MKCFKWILFLLLLIGLSFPVVEYDLQVSIPILSESPVNIFKTILDADASSRRRRVLYMQRRRRLGGEAPPSNPACDGDTSDGFCEDFDSSNLCYAGYSSNCQETWDSLTLDGGTIDFDSSVNLSTTKNCDDKGAYLLDISTTDVTTQNPVISEAWTDNERAYVGMRVCLDEVTAINETDQYVHIGWIRTQNGASGMLELLLNYDTDPPDAVTGLVFALYNNRSSTSLHGTTVLAEGTCYILHWKFDSIDDEWELKINGAQEIFNDSESYVGQAGSLYLGLIAHGNMDSGDDIQIQIDSVKTDDDAYPTVCGGN